MKRFAGVLAGLLLTASLLAACTETETVSELPVTESAGTEASSAVSVTQSQGNYSDEDFDDSWDESQVVKVDLSAAAAAAGVSVNDSGITISQAGTYLLSGALEGQVIVDAGSEDVVRLVLNGADISCGDSAAIYAKQAAKTIIILAEGSENILSDGEAYTYAAGEDEPDAALFAKDDLTITGSGALTVEGNFNNGIGSKDQLVITGGTLTVTAVNHGIRGRDSVSICAGEITIEAGNDGIQSNNDEDSSKGWIVIDGGTFSITSDHDGIQAETSLVISGGEFTLLAGGGSVNAESHTETGFGMGNNRFSRDSSAQPAEDAAAGTADTADTASDSYKGLKAGTSLQVDGGTFSINAADDALHSNGELTVSGGDFIISTGDDGFHADETTTVSGGNLLIETCYEGLEGNSVVISGGSIQLTSSDDGINAAGDGETGFFGMDSFSGDSTCSILISGGSVWIEASGDGIDSNGTLEIPGGTVVINGPTSSGDGSLDYGTDCSITGGIFLAAGSTGMLQLPGSNSTQPVLAVYFDQTQQAGTLVSLWSGDEELITFSPSTEYQAVVFSLPGMTQGQSYSVYSGGSAGTVTNGVCEAGTYTGGTLLTEVTLTDTVTSISQDGSAVSGGMGGMNGGFGGGRGGAGMPNTGGGNEKQRGSREEGTAPQEGGDTVPTFPGGGSTAENNAAVSDA